MIGYRFEEQGTVMLKRKLHTNINQILNAKKKAEEGKLDILFSTSSDTGDRLKPTNVSDCLDYIRNLVEWKKFCGERLKLTCRYRRHFYQ